MKKNKNKRCLTFILMLMVLIITFGIQGNSFASEKNYKLVLGGIQSAEDTATLAMMKMAEIAKENSNGSITIEVYPASQLGNATSQIEAVGMGSQDMFVDAGGFQSIFVKNRNAESMWFLFRNEEHYRAFLSSELNAEMEEEFLKTTGVRILANNWVRVPRVLASKSPVRSVDDFKGLKMRVPDIKAYLDSSIALEAYPTQIAWGETYLALKQGVVDACESPLDQMYTMNFYDATMNITLTNHLRDNLVVCINDGLFSGMSENQKQILIDAAIEAGNWYSETCKEASERNVELMKKAGCQFYEIDQKSLQEKVLKKINELENQGQWAQGLAEQIANIGN